MAVLNVTGVVKCTSGASFEVNLSALTVFLDNVTHNAIIYADETKRKDVISIIVLDDLEPNT